MAQKPVDQIPKGQQKVEDQGDDRPVNEAGLWVHEEASQEQGETVALEATSQAAADAFLRMGFRQATDKEVDAYKDRMKAAQEEKLEVYKKQQESAVAGK